MYDFRARGSSSAVRADGLYPSGPRFESWLPYQLLIQAMSTALAFRMNASNSASVICDVS